MIRASIAGIALGVWVLAACGGTDPGASGPSFGGGHEAGAVDARVDVSRGSVEAGIDAAATHDATMVDSAAREARAGDSGLRDATVGDSALHDAMAGDSALHDAAALDAGARDSALLDATPPPVDARPPYELTCPGDAGVLAPDAGPGTPEVLASNESAPELLVTDCAYAYWVVVGGESILRVPLAGGTPTTVLTNAFPAPSALAVDSENLYWSAPDFPNGGYVVSLPVAGGTPSTLASSIGAPYGLAVDATNVYWVEQEGNVWKVPKAGGAKTLLAVGATGSSGWIAVSSTTVVWSETTGLFSVPLDGGATSALWSGDEPVREQVLGDSVYFVTLAAGTTPTRDALVRVPVGGGAATTLATVTFAVTGLALSSADAFVSIADESTTTPVGSIVRAPLDGGAPVTLNATQRTPYDVSLRGDHLYWVDPMANDTVVGMQE